MDHRDDVHSDLGPEWIDRLEVEADHALWRRAMAGSFAYGLVLTGFSSVTEFGRAYPRTAWSLTIATWIFGLLRLVALSPGKRATVAPPVWRAAFVVFTLGSVGMYGAYGAAAIWALGVSVTTCMIPLAAAGFAAGIAHALAPRPYLMRGSAVLLIAPTAVSMLLASSPLGPILAALLVLKLAYVIFLGHTLGAEYWDSAVTHAQLQRRGNELLRSQKQTRQLIEKNPDAMGILRGTEIVFVNPAWSFTLQYQAGEIVGRPLEAFVAPADAEALRRFLAQDDALLKEFRFHKKDGSTVSWEVTTSQTLHYEGGESRLVVARDLTERNRIRAQLGLSERLASIGTLAAGIAHEINNPLAYVLGNLEHLQEELRAATPLEREAALALADIAGEAQTGAERVRQIVGDLKAISRVESTHRLKPVDLAAVIDFTLRMVAGEVRHRARVEKDFGAVPLVLADEAKLGQVFLNLLLNAAHAIPEGDATRHAIRIVTATDAAGDVTVQVSDTGVGIAPQHLERIFDPFFTTKAVGEGTGLGLSICHATVRAFGGAISVASKVGRGTTFTVRLRPATSKTAAASCPPPASPRGDRGRVLVVDDEICVGRSLERLLGKQCDVVVEHRAREALARLSRAESFDVILCDLMMPEMSGIDFFERATERDPAHGDRFVFMTGGAFTPKARAFLESVPNERVEKPFDIPKLRELIGRRLSEPPRLDS
jgi:PAS domain S-box-containing protein